MIDSADFPVSLGCLRIDHHVDNGWTNLDSAAAVDFRHARCATRTRIVANYLDPDAILSAAVISHALLEGFDVNAFLATFEGKAFYSAAFWCDYGTGFTAFTPDLNAVGNQLELWLRQRMDTKLGEDRWKLPEIQASKQTVVFGEVVGDIRLMLQQGKLSDEVLQFPGREYLSSITEECLTCVRSELGVENFGVINTFSGGKRVVPRAYFELFAQPMIVRVIQEKPGDMEPKHIFIGINPALPDWESLNLEELALEISRQSPYWRFSGRRGVIGIERESRPLSELLTILENIQVSVLRDTSPMWSVYNQAR